MINMSWSRNKQSAPDVDEEQRLIPHQYKGKENAHL